MALDKKTSELVCKKLEVFESAAKCICQISPDVRLEKSARWSQKITMAEAHVEGFEKDVIGMAKVEFLMDFHYNITENTLIGVDNSGFYQVWSLPTGSLIGSGSFTKNVDDIEYGITMNAVAHTGDWIFGVTALEDTTNTIYAHRIKPTGDILNDQVIINVSVTGITHIDNDNNENAILWFATDSGPFFLDTRYPIQLWAILPGTRWLEAVLKIEDDMLDSAMAVNTYVSSFSRCTTPAYIEKINQEHKDCRLDLDRAWYFNNVFYPVMSENIRPHFIQSTGNNEILTLSTEGALWASQHDNKIVPIAVAGGLSAATIRGAVVIYCEDKTLVLVQSPWAEKKDESFSKKPIRKTLEDKIELTRFNDTGCDTKYMVAAVSPTAVVTHAFDDGVYVFHV